MDPRKLHGLPNPTGAIEQYAVASGYVSTAKPAPTGFEDPVWVILPEHSTERPVGPLKWPAIHGSTLPVQGTRVTVVFDGEQVPKVAWWEGTHTGGSGERGEKGERGETGPEGKEGKTGPEGPKGATGATGTEGPEGKAGPWATLTLATTVEADSAGLEPAVRSEGGASVARLRGILKVKTADEVKTNGLVFTVPTGKRPEMLVAVTCSLESALGVVSVAHLTIHTNGEATLGAPAVIAAGFILLDGLTWSLT